MEKLKVTFYKKRKCTIDINSPYFMALRNHFSYDNPAARYTKYSRLPERLYSITMKGYCDVGLLWLIIDFIKEEGWNLKLDMTDRVKSLLVNEIKTTITEVSNNKKYKLRDYQRKAVENALKLGGGIGLVGTGGGKSLIISTLLETLYTLEGESFKSMLVVKDLGLIEQMYNDFTDHGCRFSFSKWSGNNKLDENSNVVIVNRGYLATGNKVKDYGYFLKTIDYLFYDEVHLFGNQPLPKSSSVLMDFDYKNIFGFTGSLAKGTYETDIVYGYFGRPFYTKSSKALRDENYLANIDIKLVRFNHDVDFNKIYDSKATDVENYNNELEYITYSNFRNEKLKQIITKLDGNVLILVDRLEQGEILEELFKNEHNKRTFFIRGSMSVDDRSKIIKEIEKSDDIICIAMSTIFSTGISVNNLPYGVFFFIGKAWNKIIQSIGRGLRLHENKDKFLLFDLCDNLVFSRKQVEKRKKIYENQEINFKEYEINE